MSPKRVPGIPMVACTLASPAALGATGAQEHVRGTIEPATANSVAIDTYSNKPATVDLRGNTEYLKDVSGTQVALEVVVFSPSMRGTGEGPYAWDKIPDTTLSDGALASSSMTNGNVSVVSTSVPEVNSSLTNGDAAETKSHSDVTHIDVPYKGGKQDVLMPPTAPIVTYRPGTKALVPKGKDVFIKPPTSSDHVANGVGVDGVRPPM